jgi:hypothetical protein
MDMSNDYFAFTAEDEYLHDTGNAPDWNESLAWCVVDPIGSSMLIRHGWRRNQGYVEATVARMNADGSLDVMFKKAPVETTSIGDRCCSQAGGLTCRLIEPTKRWQIHFDGALKHVPRATDFAADPGTALRNAATTRCTLTLEVEDTNPLYSVGPNGVMLGAEFIAGRHYESSFKCRGEIRMGEQVERIETWGVRDHSWGPRDLTVTDYTRWCWFRVDESTSAALWVHQTDGAKYSTSVILRDSGLEIAEVTLQQSSYQNIAPFLTRSCDFRMVSAGGAVAGTIEVVSTLPLRYENAGRLVRIAEYGCRVHAGGRQWPAWMEYIDHMVDGIPAGNSIA